MSVSKSFTPGVSGDFIRASLEWAGARVVVRGDNSADLDIGLYNGTDDPGAVVGELVAAITMLFLQYGGGEGS